MSDGESHTQYEARVSRHVRAHTEALMRTWEREGRNDAEIDGLVRSLVLNAYVEGRRDLVDDMGDFVRARPSPLAETASA